MNPNELDAALLRASIFVRSQVKEMPNPVPNELKLTVCLLIQIEKDGPALKEIARSDYKEVYDTKDPRWTMINSILEKYTDKPNENMVEFL